MDNLTVVKVGGSLFDHPGLCSGLRDWLAEQVEGRYLFVPGGGAFADVVRRYHGIHSLIEEYSHWLAIRAMDLNGQLLRRFLPPSCEVLDAYAFCEKDEGNPLALAHDWRVTSDAIAARVAEVMQASAIIMLKSVDLPPHYDWTKAAEGVLVDSAFGGVVERSGVDVKWINFRNRMFER